MNQISFEWWLSFRLLVEKEKLDFLFGLFVLIFMNFNFVITNIKDAALICMLNFIFILYNIWHSFNEKSLRGKSESDGWKW